MAKLRLNHTLLFTFIAAFLTMQWTTTHVHLAEHHDHDGGHHQHNIEVHAHYSIDNDVSVNANASTNANNSSHQSNDLSVIELDHEFNAQKIDKPEKPSTSFIPPTFPQLSFAILTVTELPAISNTKLSYLYRLTAKPRAPPLYS